MTRIPGDTPLLELPVTVIDFETTGLHPWRGDAVIEIGAIQLDGPVARPEGALSQLVNPQRPSSPGAREVHGISDEELQGAPAFPEVASALLEMLEGRVVAGQNVGFDLGFLRVELERMDHLPPLQPALDTVLLGRAAFPGNAGGYGLDELMRLLEISDDGVARHRALDDARVTAMALLRLAERLHGQGVVTLRQALARCTQIAIEGGRKHAVRPGLVEVILDALDSGNGIEINYTSPHGSGSDGGRRKVRSSRVIEPVALRGLWLDAYCRLREGLRTFRLDRITDYRC